MKPYYDTMPKFEFPTEVWTYLDGLGQTLERHDHLPVQDAWDDDKWVCEVPGCKWQAKYGLAAQLRTAIEALPEPTLGKKGGVERAEVLRLIDEYLR